MQDAASDESRQWGPLPGAQPLTALGEFLYGAGCRNGVLDDCGKSVPRGAAAGAATRSNFAKEFVGT